MLGSTPRLKEFDVGGLLGGWTGWEAGWSLGGAASSSHHYFGKIEIASGGALDPKHFFTGNLCPAATPVNPDPVVIAEGVRYFWSAAPLADLPMGGG